MKFALIFLSTFLVISDQQFQHQGGLVWWSPYPQQSYFIDNQETQPFVPSYQQSNPSSFNGPFYYGNVPLQQDANSFLNLRRYKPNTRPVINYIQVRIA